jgi:Flp pilus assembly pilin Flp
MFSSRLQNIRGSASEYALLLSLCSIAMLNVLSPLRGGLEGQFARVSGELSGYELSLMTDSPESARAGGSPRGANPFGPGENYGRHPNVVSGNDGTRGTQPGGQPVYIRPTQTESTDSANDRDGEEDNNSGESPDVSPNLEQGSGVTQTRPSLLR